MIINLLAMAPLGIGLVLVGTWGHRNLDTLCVISGMEATKVAQRRRVIRRGVRMCFAIAGVFFVVACVSVLS